MKIIDTTKSGIKPYLDNASKQTKSSYHSGESMKLAFITALLDAASIAGDDRSKIGRMLMATPGWFGCGNNSACRQAYENAKGEETLPDYKF